MKRNKVILLSTLAVLVMLGGCKGGEEDTLKSSTEVGTTAPGVALTEIVSWTQVETRADGETTVVVASTARNVTAAVKGENGETVYVPVTVSVPRAPETGVERVSVDSGSKAPTTAAKTPSGAGSGTAKETTLPGGTVRIDAPTAATTNSAATTVKPTQGQTGTTRPAEKPVSTTRAESTTSTVPAVTATTKPGDPTTVPNLQGERVQTVVTFLNPAQKQVSAMSGEELSAYGVPTDKQAQMQKNPGDWTVYSLKMDFTNKEATPITLYHVLVSDNGKGDVFLNGTPSAELGIGTGSKKTDTFYVIAKRSDADTFVLKKIGDLSMRVQYAAATDSGNPNYVYAKVGK